MKKMDNPNGIHHYIKWPTDIKFHPENFIIEDCEVSPNIAFTNGNFVADVDLYNETQKKDGLFSFDDLLAMDWSNRDIQLYILGLIEEYRHWAIEAWETDSTKIINFMAEQNTRLRNIEAYVPIQAEKAEQTNAAGIEVFNQVREILKDPRTLRIYSMFRDGCTREQIAEELNISLSTVDKTKKKIDTAFMKKFNRKFEIPRKKRIQRDFIK